MFEKDFKHKGAGIWFSTNVQFLIKRIVEFESIAWM